MHILSLAPTSFFNDYGCHVRILEEARALQTLGHTVTVVTYFKGKDVPGLEIIRTRPTPWRSHYEVGSSRHKFAFDVLLGMRLLRVLSGRKFDVIHAHLHEGALIGSLLAKPWRTPVVFDYQGSLTDEMLQHRFIRANTPPHRFFEKLEQVINRLPNAIVTSTRSAADVLRSSLETHKSTLIEPLPDGVNTQVVRPDVISPADRALLRATYGIAADEFVVAFLGLLAEHQGIRCLIEAAAYLKSRGRRVRWLVMGYPGVLQWRAAAANAGVADEVIFPGRVPYEDMPRMLALGDIAAAPKLSLSEGSGKILNYMAMALPTVAFDTPAQREILGALGVYVPIGESLALADRVIELMEQPIRRQALGQQLRRAAVQSHGWDRAAQTMTTVYETLLAPRHTIRTMSSSHVSQTPHDK
jgi:glycosyltransferase involved in cell wall biosynthesis